MADNLKVIDADGNAAYFKTTDTGSSVHQVWHKTQPFAPIAELGLTELIGTDEQVDQNDYSGSVGVALGGTYSGELLNFTFYTTEDGTGGIRTPAGILYIFDADPSISSGDTSMTAAERVTVLSMVEVAASDWDTDTNGGSATIYDQAVPFHGVSTLYFAFKLTSATSFNDAAGDDEQLEFNAWYNRYS